MSAPPDAAPTCPPDPDRPLEQQLTYLLHQFHKLSDAPSNERYWQECGLPLGEGRCLATVGSFAPLSVVELGQRANLDKGQASRAAQALVDRGLVHKAASSTDGRGVVLTLTDAGRQSFERVMTLVRRRNHEIFGCLDHTEQEQLRSMLLRLIEHARSA